MNSATTLDWKYYLGLTLLGTSFLALGVIAAAPALFPAATAAAVVTGGIIAGEVSFWASAVLLGKPFFAALKAKVKGWFCKDSESSAPPVCEKVG